MPRAIASGDAYALSRACRSATADVTSRSASSWWPSTVTRTSVVDAPDALSADCREILDRFFARDESYRTIGEALELPAGTIASRISRCLGKLREKLEGRKPSPDTSGGS